MAATVPIHPNGDIFMPSLGLLQINEENINYLMETFDLSQNDIAEQLFNRADPECEPLHYEQDEPLFNENTNTHILDKYINDYIVVDYPYNDFQGAGIIGYISIIHKGIYQHKVTGKKAYVAYIVQTCSLAQSTETTNILRETGIPYNLNEFISEKLNYFKSLNAATTTSINKFVVHYISKLLFESQAGKVDYVLLYSTGIKDESYNSHPAHRAARKKNACSFLTEWNSIVDGKPLKTKDELDSNDLVYLWSPIISTNDLYNFFKDRGSNISDYNEKTGNLGCQKSSTSSTTGSTTGSSGGGAGAGGYHVPVLQGFPKPTAPGYGFLVNNTNEKMNGGSKRKNKRSRRTRKKSRKHRK